MSSKNKNPFLFMLICLVAAMFLGACGGNTGDQPNQGEEKQVPVVVCTTTMIEDITKVLAGDTCDVRGIMKPGEDPHIYELKPHDIKLIIEADLILMNGLHLEAQMGNVIDERAKGKVIKLAEDPNIKTLGSEDEDGAPDPHCWFDPAIFKLYVEKTRDALIEIAPDHKEKYTERAVAYLKELDEVHQWGKIEIAKIPQERRILVTSHDAFQYLGQAFDIKVAAIGGISTESDPTPQDRLKLKALVAETGAKALFIESSVRDALNQMIKDIAEDTGANIGGELHSDSLGEEGSGADTYLSMLKYNLTTIIEALK